MAINETTFDDLTMDQRKIAFAVYNKMASRSIDFHGKVLSEDDYVLMVKADGSEAGYRTMNSFKESVEDFVIKDYSELQAYLSEMSSRAYERIIGDGRRSYTLTHGLNSNAIIVQLWANPGFDLPFYSVEKIDENTIQVDFEEPLESDSVQIVIQSNKYSKNEVTVSSVDWGDIKNIPWMPYDDMVSLLEA